MDVEQAILTSVLLNLLIDCKVDYRHLSPPLQLYLEELLEEYYEDDDDELREKLYHFAYETLKKSNLGRMYH